MILPRPRIVIVGGGFGGITAAKELNNSKYEIILIDRTNHHLFQPLLYQVATAALSPGDIAIPIRSILRKYRNIQVIMNEVIDIDLKNQIVKLNDGELYYNFLILAPGSRHSYYGNEEWAKFAPGLKSLADALTIREKILASFEIAERIYLKEDVSHYLNFVIVGAGPTGVELAGAIAEIGKKTMLADFPIFKPEDIKVYLIDSGNKILSAYPDDLSEYAYHSLINMGVNILLNERVEEITNNYVKTNRQTIYTKNVIWAAGNEVSPLIKKLGIDTDKFGRAIVNKDLSIKMYPNVFVIGDAAYYEDIDNRPLPGIAQVAIQQAIFVANILKKEIPANQRPVFKYKNKGIMATIGKAKAVAVLKNTKFKGFFAWLLWCFIHILFLIDTRNRFKVMIEWIWYYLTFKPGARIIVYTKIDTNKIKD